MFDQEFTRFLAQLGVGGAIAGLLFFFYRKDIRAYTELWREQASLNYRQTESMMTIAKENTAAFTKNTEVLQSLHRRIDRLDLLRIVAEEQKNGETPPS